jgi:hypothetical protein
MVLSQMINVMGKIVNYICPMVLSIKGIFKMERDMVR